MSLAKVLYVLATVAFALATFGVAVGTVSLVALGLAFLAGGHVAE